MPGKASKIVSRVLAVVLGLVWGFFVAFNAVFSDVFGAQEMLGAIAYVVLSYFGLGLLFGIAWPSAGWHWTFWLAPPGVVLALLMISGSGGHIAYVLGVVACVIIGTFGGVWLGSFLRIRLRRGASSPRAPGTTMSAEEPGKDHGNGR